MISGADITGIILCGGEARRMSGVDKPLQRLGKGPLVQHVRDRLAPQVESIVIVANRSLDMYRTWGDNVVSDTIASVGPLGGIIAGATHSRTPYIFCCAGDAPFLDTGLVTRLALELDASPQCTLAVPHDGVRLQHLFLLGRTKATGDAAQAYVVGGGRSVHGFVDGQNTLVVDASDIADTFLNINTPGELTNAEQILSASQPFAGNTKPIPVEHP